MNIRTIALGIVLCLVIFNGKNIVASAQTDRKTAGESEAVVMDRLIINTAKYNWQYASSPSFEILSDTESTTPAAKLTEDAELMISAFKKACQLFEPSRDLPAQFIYCKGAGLGRFFKNVKERYGAIDGGFVGAKQNSEQAIIAMIAGSQIEGQRRSVGVSRNDETRIILNLYLKTCVARYGASAQTAPWLYVAMDRISRYAAIDFDIIALSRRSKILEERAYKMCVESADSPARPADGPGLSLMEVFNYTPPKLVFEDNMPDYIFNDDLTWGGLKRVTELTQNDTWRFYTWANQSADFIIYCLFGSDKNLRASLTRFIKSMGTKPATEELFVNCFGKSSQQLHAEMYKYLKLKVEMRDNRSSSFTERASAWGPNDIIVSHFKKKDMPPKIKFRNAQRRETARIIGDWFRLGGDVEVARRTLVVAERDSPQVCQDPRFAAAYGLNELFLGDEAKAVSLLRQATAANVQRPQAYRALAATRMDAMLNAKGGNYRLTESESEEIWTLLVTAHAQPQPSYQTYVLMTHLLARSPARPNESRMKNFIEGCRLYPDNIDLLEKAATALIEIGANTEALSLMEECMKNAQDEASKTRLAALAEVLRSR